MITLWRLLITVLDSDSALGKYRKRESRKLEDILEDEEQDEEYTNLSAAFSKTLAMADKTENTKALRRAANTFAQLVTGNPFMEESDMETEKVSSSGSQHRFIASAGSPLNQAVQNVVDSVDTMTKYATGIRDHPHAVASRVTAPMRPPFQFSALSSANQISPYDYHHFPNDRQAAVVDDEQSQFSPSGVIASQTKAKKRRRLFPRVPPFRAWLARSWRPRHAPASPASPSLTQINDKPCMLAAAAASELPLERENQLSASIRDHSHTVTSGLTAPMHPPSQFFAISSATQNQAIKNNSHDHSFVIVSPDS
jgi:hypothetical protein